MPSSDDSGKVLIIGGGLGGLALAQILHSRDVPFELFERDEAPSARKQGWAVALVEALPALEELLPTETMKGFSTTSVNHLTGDADEVAFVNAITGETAGKIGGVACGLPGAVVRASRNGLRRYLWQANDLPVMPDKHFDHYVEDESGVTAYFTDGSSSRGSLLIGADGLHSRVREQLLGESAQRPIQSQYVPIFGELNLPRKQYEPLRKLANAVILASAPGLRQMIGMLSIKPDHSEAHYFWAMMLRREDDPTGLADWAEKASPQDLYDFVLESSQHLHPTLASLIKHGGPSAITHPQPKFLELVLPDAIPEGRVTMLGDAAHAMIALRGAGANTALLDACDLGKLLIEAQEEAQDFSSVVAPYVGKMVPRGRKAVFDSRAAGNADCDNPVAFLKKFSRERADQ